MHHMKHSFDYLRKGSGEKLLFIPGGGADYDYYSYFIDKLAEEYQVTALNLPGFGRSPYISDLTLDKIIGFMGEFVRISGPYEIIVGHSLGAGLSAEFIARNPRITNKALLISPLAQNFSGSKVVTILKVANNYFKNSTKSPGSYPDLLPLFIKNCLKWRAMWQHLMLTHNIVFSNWNRIDAEVTAVLSRNDLILNVNQQEEKLREIPMVKIVELDGGHDSLILEIEAVLGLMK